MKLILQQIYNYPCPIISGAFFQFYNYTTHLRKGNTRGQGSSYFKFNYPIG